LHALELLVEAIAPVCCHISVLSKTLNHGKYCISLYDIELWLLSNDQINDLCISWRKCLHRIWGLPFNFHCYLLPLLSLIGVGLSHTIVSDADEQFVFRTRKGTK